MNSAHDDIQGITIFTQTGKAIPVQTWTGPEGSNRLRLPEYLDSWHMKVVRFWALYINCVYPPGNTPQYLFLLQAVSTPQP